MPRKATSAERMPTGLEVLRTRHPLTCDEILRRGAADLRAEARMWSEFQRSLPKPLPASVEKPLLKLLRGHFPPSNVFETLS